MTWIVAGVVLVVVFLARRELVGLAISPRTAGVNYLCKLLEARGYPHPTISHDVLGRLVDTQLRAARASGSAGAMGQKGYLVDRLPGFADLIVEYLQGRMPADDPWTGIFRDAGLVPARP